MVVVGSEHRERLFRPQFNHTRLKRLLEEQGVYTPLQDMVTIYCVRRAVPVVRPLITNSQQLRELRALRLVSRGRSDPQQPRHVIQNNPIHANNGVSAEEGDMSW